MRTAIATLTACVFLLTMSTAAFAEPPVKGGLPALEQRATELEDRVEVVEGDAEQSKVDITALQNDVQQLQSDFADLRDTSATKDEVDGLGSRIAVLESHAAVLPFAVDANGQKIGPIIDMGPTGAVVLVKIGGVITRLTVSETEILTGYCVSVYFESSDCSGPAFISIFSITPAPGGFYGGSWRCQVPEKGDTLYVQVPGPAITTTARSSINLVLADPVCQAVFSPNDYVATVDYPGTILDRFQQPYSVVGVPSIPTSP